MDALIEESKKEVSFGEVFLEFLCDIIVLSNFLIAVCDLRQLELDVMHLEVAGLEEIVVVDANNLISRVLLAVLCLLLETLVHSLERKDKYNIYKRAGENPLVEQKTQKIFPQMITSAINLTIHS